MNPKEFVEALVRVADSEAADNKPKRDADTKQSYCATRLSLLITDMISSRESEPEKEEF
jgi:hypothetical protein